MFAGYTGGFEWGRSVRRIHISVAWRVAPFDFFGIDPKHVKTSIANLGDKIIFTQMALSQLHSIPGHINKPPVYLWFLYHLFIPPIYYCYTVTFLKQSSFYSLGTCNDKWLNQTHKFTFKAWPAFVWNYTCTQTRRNGKEIWGSSFQVFVTPTLLCPEKLDRSIQ